MAGPIAIVGSGEFLPSAEPIDRALVDFSGGRSVRVAILPTAAGLEGDASIDRWLDLGVDHYEAMGATAVPLRVIDADSAEDPDAIDALANVDLVYFSGGDPMFVTETMRNSEVWRAVVSAWRHGTTLAGCSAGAMMMGSVTASPRTEGLTAGLGLLRQTCIIPHFDRIDRFRPGMAASVVDEATISTQVIGVDEHTALVFDGAAWSVVGQQSVWLLEGQERIGFASGDTVPLDIAFGA